jgi:hypothetical protein
MNDINLALQKIIDGEMKKGHTASMILGVKSGDGSVDFTGAGGSADPDSRFYIASITKMFTAAVIMQLSDEGLVDLEHPVAEYLPNLYLEGIHVHDGIDYSPILNIRQLLNHTSGLADYYENGLLDEIKDGRDRTFDVHDALEMIRGTEQSRGAGQRKGSLFRYQLSAAGRGHRVGLLFSASGSFRPSYLCAPWIGEHLCIRAFGTLPRSSSALSQGPENGISPGPVEHGPRRSYRIEHPGSAQLPSGVLCRRALRQ